MLTKCGFILCAALLSICSVVNSGLSIIDVSKTKENPDPDPDWWKNGLFYQIYIRSYKESDDGDKGIGNLRGIKTQTRPLNELGITAICISQILMSSENKEHTEAITDFTKVHPEYGTNEEFEDLVKSYHNVDIKVLLEIIINHSSKEHQKFIDEEKQEVIDDDNTKNYYVWHKGKIENGQNVPPNNWLSVYGDSAWEWSKTKQMFYLHQFGIDQPDLNYNNDVVIEDMKAALKVWLDLGVDGFILDGIPFLFEDDQFRSENVTNTTIEPYKYESLDHSYTKDQEQTFDLLYKLRAWVEEYNRDENDDETPKILITKAYTSTDNTMRYYEGIEKNRDEVRPGAHIPFNFLLLPLGEKSTATEIVQSINEWLKKMPEGQTANWLIGNHDHHRAATRFGPKLADNMNILIASLPGVMITYNGEEIGQENGEVAYLQCKDPIGCKAGPAEFSKISRDFERTPYQWDNTKHAGFTDPETESTWLPVSVKKENTNLQKQTNNPDSHFGIYENIIKKLRTTEIFKKKSVEVETVHESVIKVTRSSKLDGDDDIIILLNMGTEDVNVKPTDNERQLYEVIYTSDHDSPIKATELIWEKDLTIAAFKSVVLKVFSKKVNYDWWKHAVIYQIYPRSFKDTNNDGIGDLNGIINKMEYLKGLGVDAILLSSIYKSPQNDVGYDIEDFEKVDESYGNNEALTLLIKLANFNGIHVILDFVPNHSSDQHELFKKSDAASPPPAEDDYYIWQPGRDGDKPPNNWLSIYKDSAWTKGAHRDEYYLHQFDSSQPDFDFQKVKKKMKEYLTRWLKLGVSGFRMSAAPYLFEEEYIEDEPASNDPSAKKGEWKFLKHVYTSNLPDTFNIIYEFRNFLDIYSAEEGGDERILITEAYTDIYNTMYYYGNRDKRGAQLALNFQLIEKVDSSSNANHFAAKINEWIDLIPEGFTSNWVLGNHDKHRVATRFGSKNVDGLNMLAAILPGVMVAYNGEEIGQEDGEIPLDHCKGDPIFCKKEQPEAKNKELLKFRRDSQRTPFQWDNSTYAGFSTDKAKETWLPVSIKYKDTNLALQTNQSGSHYELYKRLIRLRKEPAFVTGSLKVKSVTDNVLTCLRSHPVNDSYFHLFNLRDNEEIFNLKTVYNETTLYLEVIETNDPERLPTGTLLNTRNISLQGHQSIIAAFTTKTISSSTTIHPISCLVPLLCLLIMTINFN